MVYDDAFAQLLDQPILEACYLEGLAQLGPGAVLRTERCKQRQHWKFVPLNRLHKHQNAVQNSTENLAEMVESCPAEKCIVLHESYEPCWPLGRKLSVTIETLRLI